MMKKCLSITMVWIVVLLTACGQSAEAQWQEQYDLGLRYLSEGNYEEAIIAFTAAVEIDPNRAEAYLGISDCYVAVGDAYAAIDILESGFLETNDDPLQEQLAQLFYELDDEMKYSRYCTAEMIRQEDITIANRPFYEFSIEDADELLPKSDDDEVTSIIHTDGIDIPGQRSCGVARDDSHWGLDNQRAYEIITVIQRDDSNTLTGLQYSDFYNNISLGIQTGICGISTGDSMETVLEKLGIRSVGARLMANSGDSFYIGADTSIEGGADWIGIIEIDNTSIYHGVLTRMIDIGMNDFHCQMNFVKNKLVGIYIEKSHNDSV